MPGRRNGFGPFSRSFLTAMTDRTHNHGNGTYRLDLTEQQMRDYARSMTLAATNVAERDGDISVVRELLSERQRLIDMLREDEF